MQQPSRGRIIRLAQAAAVGCSSLSAAGMAPPAPEIRQSGATPGWLTQSERSHPYQEFTAGFEGILGTSMDLLLCAPRQADAIACQAQILDEIERLRRILSTYDASSEIRRFMAGGPIESPELAEMLDLYTHWQARTHGVINMNMAGVIHLWKSAAARGHEPTESDLRRALTAPRSLNIDALGKGFIIDRAVAVARNLIPAGLIDIGGDLRAWGPIAFTIGIANPNQPADNEAPLAIFNLQNAAVATSGSYARSPGGRGLTASAPSGFSHLINPLALTPAHPARSATVITTDCVTANAISTAACILDDQQSQTLADQHATAYLLTNAHQTTAHLAGVNGHLAPPANKPLAADAAAAWPADFQVSIDVTLKAMRGGRVKRPYVAIWVEDSKGKPVRSITLWGMQGKYVREMTEWWKATRGDPKLLRSITRATRPAGKYTVTWDGRDDAGNPVPKGDYTIKVEINREHGRHVGELVKLSCQDKKVAATLKATAESDESSVTYGPKGK